MKYFVKYSRSRARRACRWDPYARSRRPQSLAACCLSRICCVKKQSCLSRGRRVFLVRNARFVAWGGEHLRPFVALASALLRHVRVVGRARGARSTIRTKVNPLVFAKLTAFALVFINRRVELSGQIVNARRTKIWLRRQRRNTMLTMCDIKGVDKDDEDVDDLDDSG